MVRPVHGLVPVPPSRSTSESPASATAKLAPASNWLALSMTLTQYGSQGLLTQLLAVPKASGLRPVTGEWTWPEIRSPTQAPQCPLTQVRFPIEQDTYSPERRCTWPQSMLAPYDSQAHPSLGVLQGSAAPVVDPPEPPAWYPLSAPAGLGRLSCPQLT